MKFKHITIDIEKKDHAERDVMPYFLALPKRDIHSVRNNKSGALLGIIFYYTVWREFVFTQVEPNVIWSHGCLSDVRGYIEKLNDERKAKKQSDKKAK